MKRFEISVISDRSDANLIGISRLLGAGEVNNIAISVSEIGVHILRDAGYQVQETTVLFAGLELIVARCTDSELKRKDSSWTQRKSNAPIRTTRFWSRFWPSIVSSPLNAPAVSAGKSIWII